MPLTNYTEIQITLSPTLPYTPQGINTNTTYTIIKQEDELYIKSEIANEEPIPTNEFVLEAFFIIQGDISWDDVDFSDSI